VDKYMIICNNSYPIQLTQFCILSHQNTDYNTQTCRCV